MQELKYFKEDEFKCKCGCGEDVSPRLKEMLDSAREIAGVPFVINSGARCVSHNAKVGGSRTSSHILGLAADIRYKSAETREKIVSALEVVGFRRIGLNNSFVHADIDSNKLSAKWTYPNYRG